MADAFPIVSQLKSLVQVIGGDAKGAKETQINFSKQCPLVSQVRSLAEVTFISAEAARETQIEFVKNVSNMTDSVPVVGHVKGVIHYAAGDTDGGDNAMKAASRTTGVLAGGAGGFIVGGPVGAVAGGLAGGVVMDGITTGVDSAVHGEFKPSGYASQVVNIVQDPKNPGQWFDLGFQVVGDMATGKAGGKMANSAKSIANKSKVRSNFENARKPLVDKVGMEGAKDLVKAADEMKKTRQKFKPPKNKPHITSVVKDLESNEHHVGTNKQMKDFCRKNKFSDKMSTYAVEDAPTNLEKKVPDAKPPLDRKPNTCAEQRAYHKFYKKDGDPQKTSIATVRYDKTNSTIRAVERCDNCKAFDPGMGAVPGDVANNLEVPNHPGIGKYSHYKDAAVAGVIVGGACYNCEGKRRDIIQLLRSLLKQNKIDKYSQENGHIYVWGDENGERVEIRSIEDINELLGLSGIFESY